MRRLSDAGEATPLVTPASAAAAASGGVGGTLTSPAAAGSNASFDANMVIILAALLCVLICALGLNSVIRCVLHCGRRLAPSTAAMTTTTTTTSVRTQQAGLKRKALRRIPVEVYGGASALQATAATECAICLGEFADGEKVRVLPRCHHGFHVHCIDMWLAKHTSCPNCRASLAEDVAPAPAAAGGR